MIHYERAVQDPWGEVVALKGTRAGRAHFRFRV